MTALPIADPPADIELAAPFWAAFERGEIVLPRCSVCGRLQWYPDATGPDCAGGEYEWVPVAPTGTLHTFTRVHRAFMPGAAHAVPFVVGLVELDGADGVRLVANLADDEHLAIGARVEARFVAVDGRPRPVFHVFP